MGALKAAMGKAGELFLYLADLVAKRRGVAGEDVLSQLLCLAGEEALTDEEAIGLCFLFVLAGLDTVSGSLGFGMERLARNPVQRREIVDDPSQLWALGLSVYERYYGPYSEEARPFLEGMLRKRVAVKMHPERTVSWDHRKLGLSPTTSATQ